MHGHVWYLLTPLVLPSRGPRAGLPMGLSSAPSEGLCSTGRSTRALPWKFCSSGYIYNFFLACIWRSVRRQARGCSQTPWYRGCRCCWERPGTHRDRAGAFLQRCPQLGRFHGWASPGRWPGIPQQQRIWRLTAGFSFSF